MRIPESPPPRQPITGFYDYLHGSRNRLSAGYRRQQTSNLTPLIPFGAFTHYDIKQEFASINSLRRRAEHTLRDGAAEPSQRSDGGDQAAHWRSDPVHAATVRGRTHIERHSWSSLRQCRQTRNVATGWSEEKS